MLSNYLGTGKSLSLACASLAWLRYREICDLDQVLNSSNHHDETEKQTNKTLKSGLDWIDQWENPNIVAGRRDDQRRREMCHQSAKAGRQALQQKLAHIRTQIQDSRKKSIMVAKEAILAVRADPVRFNKHQHDPAMELTRIGKRKRESESLAVDFCLDEYKSDDDALHRWRDDEEEEEKDSFDNIRINAGGDHQSVEKTSRQLISGGYLDGSNFGASTMHRILGRAPSSSNYSMQRITIGNVEPGQGMRKIIYAARTHSQLSQFIRFVYISGVFVGKHYYYIIILRIFKTILPKRIGKNEMGS